jgi:hypothetical protein
LAITGIGSDLSSHLNLLSQAGDKILTHRLGLEGSIPFSSAIELAERLFLTMASAHRRLKCNPDDSIIHKNAPIIV